MANTDSPGVAYLIGRLTGVPRGNLEAFGQAKKQLESEGWEVHSPRHHKAAEAQIDADEREQRTLNEARQSPEYQAGIRKNLPLMAKATHAFVITTEDEPVEHGRGGPFEILTMQMIGVPVFYYSDDPELRRPYPIQYGTAVRI